MPPIETKFCTSCRHCTHDYSVDDYICFSPSSEIRNINLVTGTRSIVNPLCIKARFDRYGCGKEAKYFVKKR